VRRLTTDEERARFAVARDRGGICVACGRTLSDDEPVYIESVQIERKPSTAPGVRWSDRAAPRDAVLGAECASPWFLARTASEEAERCEGCGRPVYYAVQRAGRQRASCSRLCHGRARRAQQ
jgi:hypothetical protein